MASPNLSIKRHNHRVYFSAPERKNELLELILASHPELTIAVVTTMPLELPEHASAVVVEEVTTHFDLVITYDLPQNSETYINRLAYAKSFAFVLLAPEELSALYPIEMIIGRTLVQERLEGFADPIPPKEIPFPSVYERDARDERKPKSGKGGFEKKPSGRKPSGFVKKDENGKPIFSKKSGERNHRYDGTPKSDDEKGMKKPFKPRGDAPRYEGKPREERSYENRGNDEGKRPYEGKPREDRKPFDGPGKPKPKSERFDERKGSGEGKRAYEGKRPYEGKPRDERSDDRRGRYEGKKPFDGPKKAFDGPKKPFDGPRKPFDGPKKPFGSKPKNDRYDDAKGSAEGKRPYEGKPKSDRPYDKSASGEGRKPYGEGKKPFDKSKSYGAKGGKPFNNSSKPHSDKPAAPKRAPKKFALKSPKPSEKK